MLKKILCAGLLASSSVFAHAAVQSFTFSYAGFYDEENATFDSAQILSGSFSGEDGDHDGRFSKGELTTLMVGGTDYIACAASNSSYYQCGAENFSYSKGGVLHFSVTQGGSDPEGWVYGYHSIIAGDVDSTLRVHPENVWKRNMHWTPETAFSITNTSPVPEPSTYAMLALGLLAMTALQRRRQGR